MEEKQKKKSWNGIEYEFYGGQGEENRQMKGR